jgi:hydrogenase nickel incorporation protein HypA/HybF
MHEMSIALGLLDHVLAAARQHQATRVEQVEVRVGAMRMIEPEALELAFSMAAEGTAAAGAKLKVAEEPLRARCRACGTTFGPEVDSFLCPACGQADADIVEGNDILLTAVVCSADPEGAALDEDQAR